MDFQDGSSQSQTILVSSPSCGVSSFSGSLGCPPQHTGLANICPRYTVQGIQYKVYRIVSNVLCCLQFIVCRQRHENGVKIKASSVYCTQFALCSRMCAVSEVHLAKLNTFSKIWLKLDMAALFHRDPPHVLYIECTNRGNVLSIFPLPRCNCSGVKA